MTSLIMRAAAFAARILPSPVKRALYRLGPVTEAIRAGLNRTAPQGMTTVQVAGGVGQGALLALDLSSEKEIWLGTYEPELQAAIRRYGRPGMVAYDVGANIGFVSILLAFTGGEDTRVFAFEPLPTNLERLQAHIEMNGLQDRVTAVPAAIGEQAGRARFLVHASGGMGKLVGSDGRQARYGAEIDVDILALDDFVWTHDNPPPDLIKIDIEGGETKALRGMQRIFKESRPVILMEIHGPEAGSAVWEAFEQAEYRMTWMAHPERPVPQPQSLGWKAYVIGLHREWRDLERA